MPLFCPTCQAAFTGVSRCPRCAGLLLLPEEAPQLAAGAEPGPAPAARPTPGARVLFGTLAALGLYLGLRKLAVGWVLAAGEDTAGWWLTAEGLTAVFGFQMAAAVFGALLAAAGRPRGAALGAAVGGLCGGLFLAAELLAGAPGGDHLVFVLQPLVMAAAGGVAGITGAWVWAAVPDLDMPAPVVKRSSSINLNADPPADTTRPTAWLRVVVGAAVIVAGVGLAEKARAAAEKASGGMLRVESRGQAKFLSWQFAALAVLGGGAWAGAGTGAGLRHGIFTGFLGAAGVVGMMAARGEIPPPAEYLLTRLNVAPAGPHDPAALAGVGCAVLAAGLVGGWFGGQLFLPLVPKHRRNRRLDFGGD